MQSIITLSNLEAGIDRWPPQWPQDFHNQLYFSLARWRLAGFSELWWCAVAIELLRWRAMTCDELLSEIHTNALNRLDRLNAAYEALVYKVDLQHGLNTAYEALVRGVENPLDFCWLRWDDVTNLFDLASIKRVKSPVFASKLCHFILPGVYPVIDNALVGLEQLPYYWDYPSYWDRSRQFWTECDQQNLLKSCLRQHIETASQGSPVFVDYPWATKITELCWIGRNPNRR